MRDAASCSCCHPSLLVYHLLQMATIGGILLLILAAISFLGAVRAYPLGRYRSRYLRPSSWAEIIIGLGLSVGAFVVGLVLLI